MGYVMLGLGVWSASSPEYITDYWAQGVTGAMFQMIGHGISSAGMFFMVGIIYDRVHHRNLKEFGGLYGKMPFYTAMAIGLFFAGLGLPGLCGFIGEVLVVFSVWNYSILLAVIAASVVILTAGYILWCLQRVYLGPEYLGPHEEELTPCSTRKNQLDASCWRWPSCLASSHTTRYSSSWMTPSSNRSRTWLTGQRMSRSFQH